MVTNKITIKKLSKIDNFNYLFYDEFFNSKSCYHFDLKTFKIVEDPVENSIPVTFDKYCMSATTNESVFNSIKIKNLNHNGEPIIHIHIKGTSIPESYTGGCYVYSGNVNLSLLKNINSIFLSDMRFL